MRRAGVAVLGASRVGGLRRCRSWSVGCRLSPADWCLSARPGCMPSTAEIRPLRTRLPVADGGGRVDDLSRSHP